MNSLNRYKDFFQYGFYLIDVIPNYINKLVFKNDELILITSSHKLSNLMGFLKNHWNSKFKILVDITAVDFFLNNNLNKDRFELNYFLLSLHLNFRIRVKCNIDEFSGVNSITNHYSGANWFERETWDMFGIFFFNHPDLRRILTDYGFDGFPFRKDFPQSGYIELRYDEEKKAVIYEPIEMSQEFRSFDFVSPWLQVK